LLNYVPILMAREAMAGGSHVPDIDLVASRHRPHNDGGSIAVVHAAGDSPVALVDRLRDVALEFNAVTVGRAMLDRLLTLSPDIVVLDHAAKEFDLVRVCRDIRETIGARIVVIADDDEAIDDSLQIATLDSGADDFVARSLPTAVLAARIRAALRRQKAVAHSRLARIAMGDVVLDLDAHALYIAGTPARCPPVQFLLLAVLARQPNRVVDRDSLLSAVWGAQPDTVDPRRLRIAVSVLRGVLGSGPTRPRIETISHVGYRLVVADLEDPAA
jgi:DNA-binding response OmpR family regulator